MNKKPRTRVIKEFENLLMKNHPRGMKTPIFSSHADMAKAIIALPESLSLKKFKLVGLESFLHRVFRGERPISANLHVQLLTATEKRLQENGVSEIIRAQVAEKFNRWAGLINFYHRQSNINPRQQEFITSAELIKLAKNNEPAGGVYFIEIIDKVGLIRKKIGQKQ